MKKSDRIRVYVVDCETEEKIEDLGVCLTGSPSKAIQMYEDELEKWEKRNYTVEIGWEWID